MCVFLCVRERERVPQKWHCEARVWVYNGMGLFGVFLFNTLIQED